MVKKMCDMYAEEHIFLVLKLMTLNITVGCILIGVIQFIPLEEHFLVLSKGTIPSHFWSIFTHNSTVSFIYMIPYVGILYYI